METNEKKYSEGIAIFIDILETEGMENNFEGLLNINKIFRGKTSVLKKQNILDSKNDFERSVFSFSNCVYFLYKKNKNSTITIEELAFLALNDTTEILLKLLNKNMIFKSGVASGELYFDDGIFFGPAVNSAYKIGNSLSTFPRICVEDRIVKKVRGHINTLNLEAQTLNSLTFNKNLNDNNFFINIPNLTEKRRKILSEEKNKIECNKTIKKYNEGIAIFIDILGTKGRENNFEELLNINKIFREKTSILKKQNILDSKNDFERSVFSFSDCAFFLYKKNKNSTMTIEEIAFLAFNDINEISLKLLNQNIIFRGGIASGELYFDDDRIFFGPTVNKANQIEEKISKSPRICVENKIAIKVIEHMNNLSPEKRILNGSVLNKDLNDNNFFINLFNLTEIGIKILDERKLGDILQKTKNECNKNLKIYIGNKHVREKYEWLSEYLANVQIGQEIKSSIISNGIFTSIVEPNREIMFTLKEIEEASNSIDLKILYDKYSQHISNNLNKFLSNLYFARGLINLKLKNYEHAISDFKKELIGNPMDKDSYLYIGDSYNNLDNYQEAVNNYEKAVQLGFVNEDIYIEIARLYKSLGEIEMGNVIKFYKKAIEINPNNEEAIYILNLLKCMGMGILYEL